MLKHAILVMFFCCSSLSAIELDDKDIESILDEGAKVFDTVPFSLLKFPENNQGEYVFSFCLSKSDHWGIAPFGKSTGYRINQENQQVEEINCEINITSEEIINLSVQILKTNQRKTPWSIKRHRPCYNKKTKSDTITICHDLLICPDCQPDKYYWLNYLSYASLLVLPVFVLENILLGILNYAATHASLVYECPKCQHEWLPGD